MRHLHSSFLFVSISTEVFRSPRALRVRHERIREPCVVRRAWICILFADVVAYGANIDRGAGGVTLSGHLWIPLSLLSCEARGVPARTDAGRVARCKRCERGTTRLSS